MSVTWKPANGPSNVIQETGPKSMPADGKHEPPYTPLGLELLNRSKPGNGNREVLPADIDYTVFFCNPQVIPRDDLSELREMKILTTASTVMIYYTYM